MKKLSLIVFILLINLNIFGASISGTVKVEEMDPLGVFVYVEGENKYDITDSKGKFTISGLKTGQQYNLILQKGNLQDYTKSVNVVSENTNVDVLIPVEKNIAKETKETKEEKTKETTTTVSEVKSPKAVKVYKVNLSGKVNSLLSSDIFLQLSGQSYGIIVKPNSSFKLQLYPGKYTATFMQEGALNKKVTFVVGKNSTDAGIFSMEAIDYNNLTVKLPEKLENGVIQLYKDGYLEYSSRIDKNSKEFVVNGLKRGAYDIVVKAFGKENFNSFMNIDGNNSLDVKFINLNKENKVLVNIFPKNIEVELKLLSGNEIIRNINVKELAVLEGLDDKKDYTIEVLNPKYKKVELKRVVAGDNLEISLAREVKGTLINGYISPFNSNAKVMLLDKGEILSETTVDENGYYEIELQNRSIGEKSLRIIADNFKEQFLTLSMDSTKNVYESNIMLLPYSTKISGKVTFPTENLLTNTLVLIENIGIWQFTNSKGEYYFNNLPEEEYELTFKKMGYTTKVEKVKATKDENSIKNVVLNPIGKLIFRSNLEAYKISVNGKEINVNQKLYEYIQGMGNVEIIATKNGCLPIYIKIKLTEAGEIRDIILDFINIDEQNKFVKQKIEEIKIDIKELKIIEAESLLNELSQIKPLKSYEKEYLDIKGKLSNAKAKLFDIDRNIKFEVEKVKENIRAAENTKVGYVEKNKNLTKLYRESIDYLEKITFSHPYTTYRYDILMLQGDIYVKLGMPNSSRNAMEEARKYQNRRKE